MNTRSRRIRRSARRGFTLLEIMLVVGLLALLAALIVPNLTTKAQQAKINIAKGEIGPTSTLSQAIEAYKMDTNKWPESLKDLMEKPSTEEIATKWAGPYLKNMTKDPWDHEYRYAGGEQAKHNEGQFDLSSDGPDGQEGTEDDIVNWKKD